MGEMAGPGGVGKGWGLSPCLWATLMVSLSNQERQTRPLALG